jgi:hypothetical protein
MKEEGIYIYVIDREFRLMQFKRDRKYFKRVEALKVSEGE